MWSKYEKVGSVAGDPARTVNTTATQGSEAQARRATGGNLDIALAARRAVAARLRQGIH